MVIGDTIKKLRKQKDMTQEQLAEYLNISPQAVSRWEINSTLPDITLVPMLANIFDVTTDTLLGVDIDAKEKRIGAIVEEANDYLWQNQREEAEKLLRSALKEYPNSHALTDNLAKILWINTKKGEDFGEKDKEIIKEIIPLCEKNLAESTDDFIRHSSIQHLCWAYAAMGETEKAASYAKKMPNKHLSKENLLTEVLKGTEKYNHLQKEIADSAFYCMLNCITSLIGAKLDDGTEAYTRDERIALNHKIIDIINILIETGSFGDFNFRLATSHDDLSSLYIKKNDPVAALKHFTHAAKHAVIFDSMPFVNDSERDEYTCLLFRGIKFPFNMVMLPTTFSELLLEKSHELEPLIAASELEAIRNELRKHNTKQ